MINYKNSKLAFVDTETTGANPKVDRIIEIGIVVVENGKTIDSFSTLINPNTYIPPFILNMTGILPHEVDMASPFENHITKISKLLDGAIFVAHNAPFDYSFIKEEFKRLDITFTLPVLCTVKLSRSLYPGYKKHNLDSIIERYGFTIENRHRALDDADILRQFITMLGENFPEDRLNQAINKVISSAAPSGIEQSLIKNLPETPGVYIFYSDSKLPLYIGKSKNIKRRVLSHFTSRYSSTKERQIFEQIKRIEAIGTTGELGALILESTLVKQMKPVYNKKLREIKKPIYLILDKSKDYIKAKLTEEVGLNDEIVETFKSKKQAKEFLFNIAKEFNLCSSLLGLEKESKRCFLFHINICKGACCNKEKPIEYNERLENAFSNLIPKWPFVSKIYIKEGNDIKGDLYIFDNWKYIAKISWDSESKSWSPNKSDVFDKDIYNILKEFLYKKGSVTAVSELDQNGYEKLLIEAGFSYT